MSWGDDISSSDTDLVLYGSIGVILLIIICVVAYCSHKNAMEKGVLAEITQIGTCKDATCAIRVRIEDHEEERSTGSAVFVGDMVHCGPSRCYKD